MYLPWSQYTGSETNECEVGVTPPTNEPEDPLPKYLLPIPATFNLAGLQSYHPREE